MIEVEQVESNHKPLELKNSALYQGVIQTIQKLHGDYGIGASTAGFTAKYCNEKTGVGILRSRQGPHKFVASSIPFIRTLEYKPVKLNTLYMGTSMRQCFKFILQYQQKKFDKYCARLKTVEEKEALKKAIMNLDSVIDMH